MKIRVFFSILLAFFIAGSCIRIEERSFEPEPLQSAKLVTFNQHIKPIMASRCYPCHTDTGDRVNKWDRYNTTKTLITGVIGRVTKDIKDPLFMPKNGKPLDKEEMDLLNKWIADGLLEK